MYAKNNLRYVRKNGNNIADLLLYIGAILSGLSWFTAAAGRDNITALIVLCAGCLIGLSVVIR